MANLGDQYRCPVGPQGKLIASMMNKHHESLTLWGLTKVTIGSDSVILDVGCGGGKTVSRLTRLAPQGKVFGIDYSVDMVNFSRKINKSLIAQNRVEIIEGSVEKIGFQNDFFDLVTAVETYYFWENFSEALMQIKRVLKSGGKMLLVNELMFGITDTKTIEETHVKLFPLEEMVKVTKKVGFSGVQLFIESPWNAIIAQK